MKTHLIFIFLSLFAFGFSQSSNNTIEVKLDSKYLNETREIFVQLPKNYHNNQEASSDHYPVVYLLDYQNNFEYYTAMVNFMSKQPYAGIPEMIIVSIKNTERTRDFTPSKSSVNHPFEKGKQLFTDSGGGENFLSFIQYELKPYINKHYRTMPYELFVGHSFGGLAVVNAFLKHPNYFNAYIAHDPSLWWDNNLMVKTLEQTSINSKPFNHKVLYLSQANNSEENKNWNQDGIDAIQDFDQVLGQKNSSNTIIYEYKFYHNEHHGSLPLPANYNALKFIFQGFETDMRNSIKNPKSYILEPYENLSNRLGVKFYPTNTYLNQLIEFAKKLKQPKAAQEFEAMKH